MRRGKQVKGECNLIHLPTGCFFFFFCKLNERQREMQKCKKMDKERDLHRKKSKREKTNPSHSLMEPHCHIKSFSSSTQSENFTKNYSVDHVGFILHPPVRFLNDSVTSSSDLTGKKKGRQMLFLVPANATCAYGSPRLSEGERL